METTPKQQAIELINRANNVLIVPGRPDGDSIGSALSLLMVFKKLNKNVSVAVMEPVGQAYRFLPDVSEVNNTVSGTRDFIITLDIPRNLRN